MKLNKTLLAVAMVRKGLNFTALSQECGVSRQTLSAINNGKSCKPEVAGKIAAALDLDVIYLIEEVKQ